MGNLCESNLQPSNRNNCQTHFSISHTSMQTHTRTHTHRAYLQGHYCATAAFTESWLHAVWWWTALACCSVRSHTWQWACLNNTLQLRSSGQFADSSATETKIYENGARKDRQQPHPVSTSYASDQNINSESHRGEEGIIKCPVGHNSVVSFGCRFRNRGKAERVEEFWG